MAAPLRLGRAALHSAGLRDLREGEGLMPRAARTCSTRDCSTVITTGSRCTACQRRADTRRGTASQRGYNTPGHQRFREAVLRREPICVLCRTRWATVADHHPRSRRELITAGEDPNDPKHGRGLCKPCHDRETARHQPGGWAAGSI